MNSVNEVGHILNAMVNKTMILLFQDEKHEKRLREIWTETVIICNDWNIATGKILRQTL